MIIHHSIGFPERIPPGFHYPVIFPALFNFIGFPNYKLELLIGEFGKLCVALFIFLSGIGLGTKLTNTPIYSAIIRASRFYAVYIASFIVLLSISYLFFRNIHLDYGTWSFSFNFTFASIIEGIFAHKISANFCAEWWFVSLYLKIILVFYPLYEILSKIRPFLVPLCSLTLYLLCPTESLGMWQLSFAIGFTLSRNPNILPFNTNPLTKTKLVYPACAGLLMGCFIARYYMGIRYDAFLTPIFTYGAIPLISSLRLEKILAFLGKHSAAMWLNHTFICYIFFPKQLYALKYSILIICTLTIASLLLAIAIAPLQSLFRNWITYLLNQFFQLFKRVTSKELNSTNIY